jgi:hypothetical protein
VKSFSTVRDILDKIPVLEFVGRRFIHEARMNLRASTSYLGPACNSFQQTSQVLGLSQQHKSSIFWEETHDIAIVVGSMGLFPLAIHFRGDGISFLRPSTPVCKVPIDPEYM